MVNTVVWQNPAPKVKPGYNLNKRHSYSSCLRGGGGSRMAARVSALLRIAAFPRNHACTLLEATMDRIRWKELEDFKKT